MPAGGGDKSHLLRKRWNQGVVASKKIDLFWNFGHFRVTHVSSFREFRQFCANSVPIFSVKSSFLTENVYICNVKKKIALAARTKIHPRTGCWNLRLFVVAISCILKFLRFVVVMTIFSFLKKSVNIIFSTTSQTSKKFLNHFVLLG